MHPAPLISPRELAAALETPAQHSGARPVLLDVRWSLGGGADLPVLGPAVALAGFVLGAAAGGRALRGMDKPWRRSPALLAVVAVVVATVGVVLLVVPEPPDILVPPPGSTAAAFCQVSHSLARP